MATIDNFTLNSGYSSYFGSNYGFISAGNTPQIGNINGSTAQYTTASTWYSQASINRFFTFNTTLYLDLSGFTSNGGWQDIRVDNNVFNRTSASYNSSSDQWTWTGVTTPFGNGTTHSVVVTDDGQVGTAGLTIPLGITSGSVNMNNLRDFFGEPTWGSSLISMSDMFRGGNLVPDRTANLAIPTSGTIELADFYGSETYLDIEKHPQLNSIFVGFGGSAGTAIVPYNVSTDPNAQASIDVGYKALKSVCEYRWVINVTNQNGLSLNRIVYNGTTYTNPTTPFTTPWAGNPTMRLEVDHGVQTSNIAGTVYFEVRKVWNGTTYSLTSNSAFWEVVVENAGE